MKSVSGLENTQGKGKLKVILGWGKTKDFGEIPEKIGVAPSTKHGWRFHPFRGLVHD